MTNRHRSRWLITLGAAVVVFVAVLLGVAHTPFGRALAWNALRRQLAGFGIDARSAGVEYNLLTRDVRIRGLALSVPGRAGAPFLDVDLIHVKLHPGILVGRGWTESIEVVAPRVRLRRARDGTANWPEFAGGGEPATPGPLDFGAVQIRNLDLTLADDFADRSAELTGLWLDLPSPESGRFGSFRLGAPARLREAGRDLVIQRLDGSVRFDGATVWLRGARIETPDHRLEISGRAGPVFDDPLVDATVRGAVDVAALSMLAGFEDAPGGALAVDASIGGRVSQPDIALSLEGSSLAWRGLHDMSFEAKAVWSAGTVDVNAFSVRLAGGTLTGNARAAVIGPRQGGSAALAWQSMQLSALQSAVPTPLPFVLGAVLNGRVDARWTEPRVEALTLTVENRSRGVPGAGSLDVDGTIALGVADGLWTGRIDSTVGQALRIDGSVGGRLSADDPRQSTLAGNASIAVADLGDAVRAARRASQHAAALPGGLGGKLAGSLEFGGTLASPAVTVALDGERLEYGSLEPASLMLNAVSSDGRLDVTSLQARSGGNSARGTGSVTFASQAIAGRVEASLDDLGGLAAGGPGWLRLAGAGSVSVDIGGSVPAPDLRIAARGGPLAVAGQAADRWSMGVRFDGGRVTLDSFVLSQPSGELTASGRYAIADGSYAARVSGRSIVVRPIPRAGDGAPIPVRASLDVAFEGSGTLSDPGGRGRIAASNIEWAGRDAGGVQADLTVSGHALRIAARMDDQPVVANGTFQIAPPGRFAADAIVTDLDLARLAGRWLPDAGMIRGVLSAAVRAEGDLPDLGSAPLSVELRRLEGAFRDSRSIRLVTPSHVRWDGGALEVTDTQLQMGTTVLRMSGAMGPGRPQRLTASLDGELADLGFAAPIAAAVAGTAAPSIEAAGELHATLTASGDPAAPVVEGEASLRNGSVRVGAVPGAGDIAVAATFRDRVLELREVSGMWQGARVTASGRVPASVLSGATEPPSTAAPAGRPRAQLTARIDKASEAVLAPWLDAGTIDRLRADLAGGLTLEADALSLDRVRGQIELQRAQATIGGVVIAQSTPTRIAIENGGARVLEWNWAGPGSQIVVRGSVGFQPDGRLNLTTEGHADLALLGALVPDVGTTGQARLNVRAHGTLAKPELDGRIDISGGGLRLADPRLIVTGLAGALILAGDRITVDGLNGTANGGDLRLSGALSVADLAQPTGSLAVEGRGIALDLQGLRTEVDTDLRLVKGDGRPALSGSVTVRRGSFREPLSLTGGLLAALRQQDLATSAGGPSLLDTIDLNIRVTSADDLVVDNNYGQLQLGADVRVVGTPSSPGLVGRATVREGGQIFLGGNVFRIDGDGTIDFTDASRITPNLSIRALTRIGSHEVTLTAKGTPEDLRTGLGSDSGLGQADLVSLLLTGQTLDKTGGSTLGIPPDQLLGYLSGEFLGSAGRAVGLDTVRIQRGLPDVQFNAGLVATETDPSARLTFGKDVTPNLQLIFSQSLKETNGLTWIVSYTLGPSIELRAVTLDDGDRSYDFRHAVTFGGPARASRAAARKKREPVADVTFTGSAGDAAAELAGRIKLRRGDRFDFFKWQADRDRIESFFAERGYYEARVTATRKSVQKGGPAGVTLEYDVHRGPKTTLSVEGFDLPKGTVRDLHQIWQRTTFDQFLIDEVTSRARAHLIERGFLRASASAAIDQEPDRKELVLRIDPGPRTARRAIAMSGNESIATGRLLAFIESRQLSDTAWVNPERLRPALLGLYRDEGRLAASVRVRPPVFEADTARLPVEILEGPEFQIGEIVLDGVSGLPEPAARTALELETGDRYAVPRIESARRRLEARYRKAGFTEAAVALATDVDADASTVRVSLTVREGPRHVLRDVVTTGARRTDTGLISRALKLGVGEPVDLASWYEARSRLYDTGVFRSVDIEEEPIDSARPAEQGVSEQPVRAAIALEEWPPLRLRYGLQVNDELRSSSETRQLSPGLSADLTYRNLFGRAMTTGLAGRYDANFQAVRAFGTAPALAGRPITTNVFVSRSREELGQSSVRPFVTDRTTLVGEQRIRPRGRLEFAYSYNFERNHTFDRDPAPGDPLAFDISVNVARLTASVVLDARNDLVDATRGWFHSATIEYAASALGSDVRFVKLVGQQYYYRSLPGRIVLASAARVGLGTGFGQLLLPSERFFTGGDTSLRGFEQDSVGPTDFFGDPSGGNALLLFNQEVRFPLFKWFRGVGFADAGNAFAAVRDVSLGDLRLSLGVGTRIQTPLALVRIDFGVPVGRLLTRTGGRWIFSVGQAF